MILTNAFGRSLAAGAAALVFASISLLAALGPAANPGLMI